MTVAPAARAFVRAAVGGLPRSFWVLWTGTLVNRLGTMVLPFLSLYLTGGRHLSVTTAGVMLALVGAGQVFSQLIGGALADRVGRRAALTGGMLATGFAMIGLGYGRSIGLIAVFALLFGLAIDAFRPAVQAMVADFVPAADRPRAYGLLLWSINIGFSVAMVAGGTLADRGFLPLFWVDAGTCALFGLLVWRAVPETRGLTVTERESGGFVDVFRDRVMVGFVLIVLAAAFVFLQSLSTLPLAMRADGRSSAAYGLVMAVNGVVIVLVQPLLGPKLGRWDHSRVLVTGFALLGLGFGATALATSTLSYAAVVVVWTCGEVVIHSVAAAVVADLAPAHLRGRYGGAYGTAWGLGALLAPLGGTRLLGFGASALWVTCLGICLLAVLGQLALAPAIRRRSATDEPEAEAATTTTYRYPDGDRDGIGPAEVDPADP